MTVLDVSEANGSIDWAAAAGAVDAAVLRAGYRGYGSAGRLITDAQWEVNAGGCISAGLPFGAYWVSQALDEREAVEEAAYLSRILADKPLKLPVFLDSEWGDAQKGTGRADRISPEQRSRNALAFLRNLRERGYRTGIYTGCYWFREEIDGESLREDGHFIWLASVESVMPDIPWDGWQYTWQGRVPGIATAVDLSHFREYELPEKSNTWSAEARNWAVKQGLFQGDGQGNYSWSDPVTREQLATILWRLQRRESI